MDSIDCSMSVGGCAYSHVTNWVNHYGSQQTRIFKQISAEFAYAGIMVFSALETAARGTYFLALKAFCEAFKPSNKQEWNKKYTEAAENFILCAIVMGSSAISLFDNAMKFRVRSQVKGKIIHGNRTGDKVLDFYSKTFTSPLRAMGFNIP